MLNVFSEGEGAVHTSDGVRIFYRTAGEGERTLLFMHGWGGSGSGSFWTPLLRHLDPENLRFVLVDLRGHGRSEHTRDGFTTERFAEDMFEVADHVGARELIPVGYSMSGRWAQWMACSRPECVVGQVLVGPAPASAMPLTPELADDWVQSVATREGYHRTSGRSPPATRDARPTRGRHARRSDPADRRGSCCTHPVVHPAQSQRTSAPHPSLRNRTDPARHGKGCERTIVG